MRRMLDSILRHWISGAFLALLIPVVAASSGTALAQTLQPCTTKGTYIRAPHPDEMIRWRHQELMKKERLRINTQNPSSVVRSHELHEQARREILKGQYTPPPGSVTNAARILNGINLINSLPVRQPNKPVPPRPPTPIHRVIK